MKIFDFIKRALAPLSQYFFIELAGILLLVVCGFFVLIKVIFF